MNSTHNIYAGIFGVCIILSTASSLRLSGIPIGPAEAGLAIWIILTFMSRIFDKKRQISVEAVKLLAPVIISLLAISIGWIINYMFFRSVVNSFNSEEMFRNFIATIFCTLVSIAIVIERKYVKQYLISVGVSAWLYIVFCLFVYFSTNGVRYQGFRFTGYSENPNQFSFCLSIAIGVFIYLLSSKKYSIFAISGIILAVYSVVLSQSDAFSVSFPLAMAIIFYKFILAKIKNARQKVITSVLLLFSLLVFVLLTKGYVIDGLDNISGRGNQGRDRELLWSHGIEAWLNSPIFGLGPWGFSGITGPFQEEESHNNYIEILTNGGLVYLFSIIFLLWNSFIAAIRARGYGMLFSVSMVALIGMFHYVSRQPIFWTALLIPILMYRQGNKEYIDEKRGKLIGDVESRKTLGT